MFKIYLRDRNAAMCEAWQKAFDGCEDVIVTCGDIFGLPPEVKIDAIVSPANAFAFMDGSIDYVYSMRFGWDLSTGLRQLLRDEYHGELLVGQSVIVLTGDKQIPHLVCAPTMRVPMDISETVNAYLAFRAVLLAVKQYNEDDAEIGSILCPGLGTAVGRMPPRRCAIQMFQAYKEVIKGEFKPYETLEDACQAHFKMLDLDLDFVAWRIQEGKKPS